jgi:phage terminase large subunit-like protein
MAETKGRKGRSDKGQYRPNRAVTVPEQIEGERPSIPEVDPLYHTYDASKPEGAYFDEQAADHVVEWIESNLRHYKAEWAGQPFLLLDWQKRLLRHVFGWKRANGYRLYRRVYVECPRKAGKTTLAAAVAVYLAFADGENAPQIVFAAKDKEQAGICYDAATRTIEANSELYSQIAPFRSPKRFELRNNPGGWLKPIASDAENAQGLEIHGLIFDELAMQKNRRELWTALTKGSNTRNQPMLFGISTAGYERVSICFEQHEKTRQIMEGTVEDPRFFGLVYGAPMDADWDDPEVWRNANPSMGATVKPDAYMDEYNAVKAVPAEQNEFRIFQLSQWVGQESRYIDMEAWKKCAKRPNPAKKRPAYGGLDLSATTDLTCLSVVAQNKDGSLDLYSYPFLPEDGLRERMKRDGANYELWSNEGYLTFTPGPVISQGAVKKSILDAAEAFDLKDIGYDRHLADRIVEELKGEGLTMVPVAQNAGGMSPPTKILNELVLEGKLNHGGDPLLQWCVEHFAVSIDAQGNVLPNKMKATQRIDPVVSAIIALDGWQRRGKKVQKTSAYSSGFYAQFMPTKESEVTVP